MTDYTFENGSKMTNPQPDDPNYTFENGTKPEVPKAIIDTQATRIAALEHG